MWFFSKMYRILQRSMMGTSLSNCSNGLPKTGTMHNGNIYELKTQARHTVGNGGSVSHTKNFPTPRATDGISGVSTNPDYFGETETGTLYRQSAKGTRYGMSLTQYAQHDIIKKWGTPRASSQNGTGPMGSKSYDHDLAKGYLRAQVIEAPAQGLRLNPDWVEQLMGYPTGWTSIDSPPGETNPNTKGKPQESQPKPKTDALGSKH